MKISLPSVLVPPADLEAWAAAMRLGVLRFNVADGVEVEGVEVGMVRGTAGVLGLPGLSNRLSSDGKGVSYDSELPPPFVRCSSSLRPFIAFMMASGLPFIFAGAGAGRLLEEPGRPEDAMMLIP